MNRLKILNATNLKITAVILMVFDHVHQMFAQAGAPAWLTWLGRPVFPMFLFIMAESFHYTRNRKQLLIRLLIGSLAMTLFNLVLQAIVPNQNAVLMNNAFSTFFLAVLYMLFWDMFINGIKEKKTSKIILSALLFFIPLLITLPVLFITQMESPPLWLVRTFLLLPNVLLVEGGPAMIFLGLIFYIFRSRRWLQAVILAVLSAIVFFMNQSAQWMMVFAAIPILMYNGEKGRGMKYFFYIFYPAHIYVLYLISAIL